LTEIHVKIIDKQLKRALKMHWRTRSSKDKFHFAGGQNNQHQNTHTHISWGQSSVNAKW